MSAQTQRRTNTRVRTGGARRAMSADQALTRAQERKNSKIDAAIAAGRVAQLQKSMNVSLKLTSGGTIRLVNADGTVSPQGLHYYNKLGVEPPSIFPYEQGLEGGKWIRAFDGKKTDGPTYGSRRVATNKDWHPILQV